jgi:hypothetical protein
MKLYFCSWDKIDFEVDKFFKIHKESDAVAKTAILSSSKFSHINGCYGYSQNQFEEILSKYVTKVTNPYNAGEVTYALIYCYEIEIPEDEIMWQLINYTEYLNCKLNNEFRIWTIIDSTKSKIHDDLLSTEEFLNYVD